MIKTLTKSLLIALFGLFNIAGVTANAKIFEFNLINGLVLYQINTSTNTLVGLVKTENQVCLNKLTFKSKSSNSLLSYENISTERGRQYYERFEVNLDSNQVNIFNAMRNMSTTIPIEKRDCSVSSCTNMAVVAPCNN